MKLHIKVHKAGGMTLTYVEGAAKLVKKRSICLLVFPLL